MGGIKYIPPPGAGTKDIVLFYATRSDLPASGEEGILYTVQSCPDIGEYIWSVSENDYIQLTPPVASCFALRLQFNNIGSVPVADPYSKNDWNNFFETDSFADTPFNSLLVDGDTVTLYGASNLILKADLFTGINLVEIEDTNCVVGTTGGTNFNACALLTTAIFPVLLSLGATTFDNCELLVNVSLPKCIVTGHAAFAHCHSLAALSLPALIILGDSLCFDCTLLVSVSLPACTTASPGGSGAFGQCVNLPLLSIPLLQGTSINFCIGCVLLETLLLPEATVLGDNSCKDCTSLVNVSIDKAVTIKFGCFSNCAILEIISLPEAVTLENEAFEFCVLLNNTSFPKVETVGGYCFNGDTGLTSVSFPSALDFGSHAFLSCSNVQSIFAPLVLSCGAVCFGDNTGWSGLISLDSCVSFGATVFANIIGQTFTLRVPVSMLVNAQVIQLAIDNPLATIIGV